MELRHIALDRKQPANHLLEELIQDYLKKHGAVRHSKTR